MQALLELKLPALNAGAPAAMSQSTAAANADAATTHAASASASASASSSSTAAALPLPRHQRESSITSSNSSEPGAPQDRTQAAAAAESNNSPAAASSSPTSITAEGAAPPEDQDEAMQAAGAVAAAPPAPSVSPQPSVGTVDDAEEAEVVEVALTTPPLVPVALTCPLCSLFLYSPVTLLCGHSACSRCVQTMLKLRAPLQRHHQLLLACVCCGKLSTVESVNTRTSH